MIKTTIHSLKQAIRLIYSGLSHLSKQHFYEIQQISTCSKTHKHLLEIKLVNKSQSLTYLAEEIASDNTFIAGFSPTDIRSICYYAACDKYEQILENENIKKSLELIRSQSLNNEKTIQIRDKISGEYHLIMLKEFSDSGFTNKLSSEDAFQVGYLAGQEQAWKDSRRFNLRKQNGSLNS